MGDSIVSAVNSCLWSVGFMLSERLAGQLPFDSRQPNPDPLWDSLRASFSWLQPLSCLDV
jgi:hypothetical protein